MVCYCKKFLARKSVWLYIPSIFLVLCILLLSTTVFAVKGGEKNNPPVINPIDDKQVNEGEELNFVISGTDIDGDPLVYSTDNLPEGANFDSVSNTFLWVPTFEQARKYSKVKFHVSDGQKIDTDSINILVIDVNRAPLLDQISDITVTEGDIVSINAVGSDPDGDVLSYSYFGWMTTPSYTTVVGDAGIQTVTVKVSDGNLTASQDVTITIDAEINNIPELGVIGNKQVNEGQVLSFNVVAIDADNDTLTFTASNLPLGASFDPINMFFSWNPTFEQAGTYSNISFQVSDGKDVVEEIISILVVDVNRAPTLEPIPDITVTEGGVVLINPVGSDPDGDVLSYIFSVWMTTASYQTIPGDAGAHLVTVTASDGTLTAIQDVNIRVNPSGNNVPVLSPIGNKQVNEGQDLSFIVSATDADDDPLIFTAANLPLGATFDADSGIFQWIPESGQLGLYTDISFQVSDGKDSVSELISIEVTNINHAPVLDTISAITVSEGEVVQIIPAGTDPDGDTVSFSYSGWMTTASYTTGSGDMGVHTVTVTVSDGTLSASQDVTVTVTEVELTSTVTLSWNANTEVDLAGYKIYRGTSSRVYTHIIDVGDVTSFILAIDTEADNYLALTAYDASGNESEYSSELVYNSSVGVVERGSAPVLTPIGDKQTSEGVELSFTLSASDADGDTLEFTASNLPSGAIFNESTGIFNWTPGFDQSGTYTEVSFSVSDGSDIETEKISIEVTNVNRAPELTATSTITVNEGEIVTIDPTATDPDGDTLIFSYSGWMTSASYTTVSGDAGVHTVTVNVSDGTLSASQDVTVTVTEVESTLTVTLSWEANTESDLAGYKIYRGTSSRVYTHIIDVGDVTSFTLTIDAEVDNYLALTAYDASGNESEYSSELVYNSSVGVVERGSAPVLTPIGDKQTNEGVELSFTLSASDADGDTLEFTASNLPSGAIFNESTGIFNWTPGFDQSGTYTEVSFSVSDGSDIETEKISIEVTNVNRAPELTATSTITVNEGEIVTIDPTATDPDGDTLIFSYSGWMTSASYTTVSGDAGVHTVTVNVSDGTLSVSQDVTVTVTEVESTLTVTLSWEANTESDLAGYKIYRGTSSRVYTHIIDVGDVTSFTLTIDAEVDNYLALTAYDTSGNESGYSSEFVYNSSVGVVERGSAPVLTPIGDKQTNEGVALSFTLSASDVDGDALEFAASNLPSGAIFNESTGIFNWTPGFDQSGTYTEVSFSVSDGSDIETEKISIEVTNVNRAPELTATSTITVNEGEIVTIDPTATDPDGDTLIFSYSGWMTSASYTTVSGDAGVHTVTVNVSDGTLSASQDVTVTVTEVETTLTVTLSWEANTESDLAGYKIYRGTSSRVYTHIIDVGDVTSFTLTIDAEVDNYLALTAYDTSGNESGYSSEFVYNSSVGEVERGSAPVLTPIGDKQTNEGVALSFTLSASDVDGDALEFAASNLPSGAIFNESTGIFNWTPGFDQSGTYTEVSFSVSDGSDIETEKISIEVTNVNRAPELTATSTITVNEGEIVTVDPTATDPDGDTLVFSYSGWMTSASYTTVSGDAGVHTVTVNVSDGTLSASQDVTVTVTEVETTLTVTLSWEANTESDLAGYKIYRGTSSRVYTHIIDVGDVTSFTLTIDAEVDNYLALTAYDTSGNESEYSSELMYNSSVGVVERGNAPVLTPIGDKQTSEGVELSFTLSASDADGDTLEFTASNLPSSASFDENNGKFSWTPGFDQSGTYTDLSFSVSDGSDTMTEIINIEVAEINRVPVLGLIPNINVNEGKIVEIQKTGADPDGDLLTYSYSGWMTSQSYTTVVGDAGTHDVTVTVTDGIASVSQDVVITVNVVVNGTFDMILSWSANTELDLAGYKLYSGKSTGVYDNIVDVNNVISYLMSVPVGVDIFFALTAYDTSGNESEFSSELLFNSSTPSLPVGRVIADARDSSREVSDKDKVNKEKLEEYKKKDSEHTESKQRGIKTGSKKIDGKSVSFDEESEEVGINRWKPLPLRTDNQHDFGLAGGEGMQQIGGISYAPSNPNTLYLVTKESQVWKSRDGGNSWRIKNHGFLANGGISISVDPNNEDVVLVAGLSSSENISNNIADGIYRTKNGGKTWELVKQTYFQGVDVPDSRKGVSNRGGVNFDFSKLGVIYAGTHEDGLLRSLDGGDTWKSILPNSKTGKILDVKGDPNDYYSLFLAAENGIYSVKDDDVAKMVEDDAHFFMNNSSFCTKCHEGWGANQEELPSHDNVFKPIPTRLNKTETCLGCHKIEDEAHPLNIKPKNATPADLPLGTNGEITCLTCHFAHGPRESSKPFVSETLLNKMFSFGKKSYKTYYLRRANPKGELCNACHMKQTESKNDNSDKFRKGDND